MAVIDAINGAVRRIPVWPCYALGFVPAVAYFVLALQNRLGADPVARLEHETGLIALQFLVAALVVTPLRELARINLLRFRRMLGLMAFWYACLHLAVWGLLDRQLDWPRIVEDLTERPYVIKCGGSAPSPGGRCTGLPIRRPRWRRCISSGWSRPGRRSRWSMPGSSRCCWPTGRCAGGCGGALPAPRPQAWPGRTEAVATTVAGRPAKKIVRKTVTRLHFPLARLSARP